MPKLKTCLLVSDDPDDHQILSEAIKEISENVVLLITVENSHALRLLKEQKLLPDYLVIDFTSEGINGNQFLKELGDHENLKTIPTIVYSNQSPHDNSGNLKQLGFFNKQSKYSEIRTTLKKFLGDSL